MGHCSSSPSAESTTESCRGAQPTLFHPLEERKGFNSLSGQEQSLSPMPKPGAKGPKTSVGCDCGHSSPTSAPVAPGSWETWASLQRSLLPLKSSRSCSLECIHLSLSSWNLCWQLLNSSFLILSNRKIKWGTILLLWFGQQFTSSVLEL